LTPRRKVEGMKNTRKKRRAKRTLKRSRRKRRRKVATLKTKENWTRMNQTMIREVLYVRKWGKISKNPT